MRRFRRIREVIRKVEEVPLRLYIFDILYCNGRELLDVPYAERRALLESTLPVEIVAPRVVTRSLEEAEVFLEQALKAGHEGLIAKALDSRYEVGHRGKRWLKIKPTETLDLVIIAADWGYGKHAGWLSNYHLAAWDEEAQRYEEIGRTYRGPSDAEFERYTQELLRLETSRSKYTVYVRPQIVVETAFAEIQKSPRYPSGFALRLASIKRYREDKGPEDADTITRVRELYEKKFQSKGRLM
jgi:DNA ligase-1